MLELESYKSIHCDWWICLLASSQSIDFSLSSSSSFVTVVVFFKKYRDICPVGSIPLPNLNLVDQIHLDVIFLGYGPFLKYSLNLVQYCFCFMFWFFEHKACGILAPQPETEPTSPELEGEVLTTGSPGKSHLDII